MPVFIDTKVAEVNTPSNSLTTILIFDNSSFTSGAVAVKTRITAIRAAAGETASYSQECAFDIDGSGNATIVSTVDLLSEQEDAALAALNPPTWDVNAGGDIRFRVTGLVGDPIDWSIVADFIITIP